MPYWNLNGLELEEFRPGIMSFAELGQNLIMAIMEIGPDMEDAGREHPTIRKRSSMGSLLFRITS